MTEPCKFEEKIIEMHGDIKTLVAEFKAMNGTLKTTKEDFDGHKKVSWGYRKKIDILWAIIHGTKWLIVFFFGSGVFFKWLSK